MCYVLLFPLPDSVLETSELNVTAARSQTCLRRTGRLQAAGAERGVSEQQEGRGRDRRAVTVCVPTCCKQLEYSASRSVLDKYQQSGKLWRGNGSHLGAQEQT